jgi:hypothetical protein
VVRVALAMLALGLLLSGCIKPQDPLKSIGQLPANSGSGARIVYRQITQQVWVVDGSNRVIDSYRVSGNLSIPRPGFYRVYAKQQYGIDNSGTLLLPFFIVFTGDVGFHGYPIDRRTGQPIQNDSQLGQPLSHGCVRVGGDKIRFLWSWAAIGTPVVVV